MLWRFFSGVTFVLFCFVFRPYAFVKAAALRSVVLRYAGVPIATRVFSFSFFFVVFYLFILVPFPLSLCMESTSYVLSFRMAFFLPCDHGLYFFYISLCENSINSINQSISHYVTRSSFQQRSDMLLKLQRACLNEVQATRPLFLRSQADLKRTCCRGRLEVIGYQGRSVVGERHGAKNFTARNSAERLVTSAIRSREDPRFLDIVYPSSLIDYK